MNTTPKNTPNLQNLLQEVDALLNADPLLKTLKTQFGYTTFRNGQREIIEAILERQNVFAIFPTGHGKSLCYQLPALILDGLTVVISPLISLMKNQVDALHHQGIDTVALINSSQNLEQYQNTIVRLKKNQIKLLYVSPERLRSRRFLNILNATPIALFVIDEAHCISQWGRDFRPAYLALKDTINTLQPKVTALFTATAPPEIQKDIINLLDMPTPQTLAQGIARPNLKLNVHQTQDDNEKYQYLQKFLTQHGKKNANGIIYAGRRRDTEQIAHFLQKRGFQANFYHAGLENHKRTRIQEAFFDNSKNGLNIVTATNAFGMGIDKPDIRYIIHWTFTSTLEEYCQEIGRAGRDGKQALCTLLFCNHDRQLHEWFIKENKPDKLSLIQLLKTIEDFKGFHNYRTISTDELKWKSQLKETKLHTCLSYLEKLEFLKRWYNVPSQLTIRYPNTTHNQNEPKPSLHQKLLHQLRKPKSKAILELSEALDQNPKIVMETLAELQSDGHIQYWGQEDLLLIELLKDSQILSTLTDEQIGTDDYVHRKQKQIDHIIHYALEETTCRMHKIRTYFGETLEAEHYQCGTSDVCQKHEAHSPSDKQG